MIEIVVKVNILLLLSIFWCKTFSFCEEFKKLRNTLYSFYLFIYIYIESCFFKTFSL